MIPEGKKPNVSSIEESVLQAVSLHQSIREPRAIEFYTPKIGNCVLCDRQTVIVKPSHKLCKTCFHYCKSWVIKVKGTFKNSHLKEAINVLSQPIPCRFQKYCGNWVSKFADGNLRFATRKRICENCMPVYVAGLKDSKLKTLESILDYKIRKAEYEQKNRFANWESRPRTKDD